MMQINQKDDGDMNTATRPLPSADDYQLIGGAGERLQQARHQLGEQFARPGAAGRPVPAA